MSTIWTVFLAMFLTGCFFKLGELLIDTIWPILQIDHRIRRNYRKVFGKGMDKRRNEIEARVDAVVVAEAILKLHREEYLPHDHIDTGRPFIDDHCEWCDVVKHAMQIEKRSR